MAESPQPANADLVSLQITVDGSNIKDTYQVTQVTVERALNRIPRADILIADGSSSESDFEISSSTDFEPGNMVEIKAGYHGKDATIFKGLIVGHGISVRRMHGPLLHIELRDEAVKTTVARTSTQFLAKTDSQIMQSIISDAGLQADVEATTLEHPQVIKHNATDWDFIVSRAEINGLLVDVDDGKLTIKKPSFEPANIVATLGDSIIDFEAEVSALDQVSNVTSSTWDYTRQQAVTQNSTEPAVNKQGNLTGQTLARTLGVESFELQSYAPIPEAELSTWADAQLLKARLASIRGHVTMPGTAKVAPATCLDLNGLGDRFNGAAFVTSVIHRVEPGNWETKACFGLERDWFSDRHRDMEAPGAAGRVPPARGLHLATVKQIHEDPEAERRIQVVLPLVAEAQDGVWLRMATPYATNEAGIFFMPEIDDEVVVGFLDGEITSGVVLGSLHSSKLKAPYEPDEPNTMKAIVTNSQMKISFDDVNKNLQIETPGGHIVTLSDENTEVTITDSNDNKMVMAPSGIAMTSPQDISIEAKGKIAIKGTTGVNIESPADVAIDGMNVNATANASLTAKGTASAELSASGTTTVKGAMVMIN